MKSSKSLHETHTEAHTGSCRRVFGQVVAWAVNKREKGRRRRKKRERERDLETSKERKKKNTCLS